MTKLSLIGIGVDCEEMSRFEKLVENRRVVEKILSKQELEVFKKKGGKKIEYLAGRFVAKESIIKALSNVIFPLNMRDISIIGKKNGSPQVSLNRRLSDSKSLVIDISISHCNSVAMALCVAQLATSASKAV